MLKDLSFEEIINFYEELGTNQIGKMKKVDIYAKARLYEEIEEKEKPIRDSINRGKKDRIENITLIGTDIAIVEVIERWSGKDETVYYPIVKGKSLTEISNSFDYALILALANKYGEGNSAPRMIYNMLRMDKVQEDHKE